MNRILATLPADEFGRLASHLESVALPVDRVLLTPGRAIRTIYFPCRGVCAVTRVMRNKTAVEIATVGSEGFVGVDAWFEGESSSCEVSVRVPDECALAMPVSAFHREMRRGGAFAALIDGYVRNLMSSVMQLAACAALHSAEQRCARWLLTMRACVGRDEFEFTQAAMASALGLRRPTVTLILSALRDQRLIDTRRRRLEILDARRLASAACECHHVLTKPFRSSLRTGAVA